MSSSKKTTSTGKLAPVTQQRIDTNYVAGQQVANRPYEPYTGTIVAPFNPAQTQSFGMFADIANQNVGGAGLQSAIDATRAASTFTPQQVGTGYQPTSIGTGFNAPQASAPGAVSTQFGAPSVRSQFTANPISTTYAPGMFEAPTVGASFAPRTVGAARDVTARDVTARDVTATPVSAGMFTDLDMSRYMNPYNQEVIQATQGDLERQRQMMQLQTNAGADAAGAFGGARHGVAASLTNQDWGRTAGGILSALRAAGFDRASDLATQDLNRRLSADTTTAGLRLAAGQSNQQADLTRTGANQRADLERTGANQQADLTRNLANQQGQITADQLGLTAQTANQGARLSTNAMNADNLYRAAALSADTQRANQAADLQAQGMGLQADTINAGNTLQAQDLTRTAQTTNVANQQQTDLANLQARMQTMGMDLDAQRFNSDAAYRAAVLQLDAQMANQQAGIQGAGINLSGASQLATLSDAERALAMSNAGIFSDIGAQQQGQTQAELDAAYQQWLQQWNYPIIQQQLRDASLSPTLATAPITATTKTTQKSTPGLFDWASLGVSAMTGMPSFGGGGGMASMPSPMTSPQLANIQAQPVQPLPMYNPYYPQYATAPTGGLFRF